MFLSDFDMIYDDCTEQWDFDLLTASAVGDEECVKNLLSSQKIGIGDKNSRGWTAIMFAAYFGHAGFDFTNRY
jgi:hypothetical protein